MGRQMNVARRDTSERDEPNYINPKRKLQRDMPYTPAAKKIVDATPKVSQTQHEDSNGSGDQDLSSATNESENNNSKQPPVQQQMLVGKKLVTIRDMEEDEENECDTTNNTNESNEDSSQHDNTDKFVAKKIASSLPKTIKRRKQKEDRRRRKKAKIEEEKERRRQAKLARESQLENLDPKDCVELKKDVVLDYISNEYHVYGRALAQYQKQIIIHCELGYDSRCFPALYETSTDPSWMKANLKLECINPCHHFGFVPYATKKELKKIFDIEKYSDPFFTPYKRDGKITKQTPIRSWDLPDFIFRYPPPNVVQPDKDVQFIEMFNEMFPDRGYIHDRAFYNQVVCSDSHSSARDPLFDYGRVDVQINNNAFDRCLLDTTLYNWEDITLFQRIATRKIPYYNEDVFFFQISKEIVEVVQKTWSQRTMNLSVSDRRKITNHVWMQVHRHGYDLYKETTKYGILDEYIIDNHFRFNGDDVQETLDLSEMKKKGYKLKDVSGDGNCCLHTTFLALVNAGRCGPKAAAANKKTKSLEDFLFDYNIKKDVKQRREEMAKYIQASDPVKWMVHPSLEFNSGGDEDKISIEIQETISCIFQKNVDYSDLTTRDTGHFPDVNYYPLFLARKERCRVVVICFFEKCEGGGEYITYVHDYRENQKARKPFSTYEEIYQIPDEDFDSSDTLELFYQQEKVERKDDSIDDSTKKLHDNEDGENKNKEINNENKEIGDVTIEGENENNTEEEKEDEVSKNKNQDPVHFGHYQFALRVGKPETTVQVQVEDQQTSVETTTKCAFSEDKWNLNIFNSNVISFVIPYGQNLFVSVYVCNYRKQPIGQDFVVEEQDENNKPFIMINCPESRLTGSQQLEIEKTIYFFLNMIHDITKWSTDRDKTGPFNKFPPLEFVEKARKNMKTESSAKISEAKGISLFYCDEAILPIAKCDPQLVSPKLIEKYYGVMAFVHVYAATFIHNNANATNEDGVASHDTLVSETLQKVWGDVMNATNAETVNDCLGVFGRKLSTLLLYLKMCYISGFEPMDEKELKQKQKEGHFGNPIRVSLEETKNMFSDFFGKEKTKSREFFDLRTEAELIRLGILPPPIEEESPAGDEENDDGDGNSDEDGSEEEIQEEPTLAKKRLYKPRRPDLKDEYKNKGKLTKKKKEELDKNEDTICPDAVKEVFDVERLEKIAMMFTNHFGKNKATNEDIKKIKETVRTEFSCDKKMFVDYVDGMANDYKEGIHSEEQERRLLTSEQYPQQLVDYQREVNEGKEEKDQVDVLIDYSMNIKAAAAMDLVETMDAHFTQKKEYDAYKSMCEGKRKNHKQGEGVTNQMEAKLRELKRSCESLQYKVHDMLDMLFPINEIYGYSETKEGDEIRMLRYVVATDEFKGLTRQKTEQHCQSDWVKVNFHPGFIRLVKWHAQYAHSKGRTGTYWTHIPAGDSKEEYAGSIEDKESLLSIEFMRHLHIEYPQGEKRYCVTCSYASALHLVHFFEHAKILMNWKEQISYLPGIKQVQVLKSFSEESIPKQYIKTITIYKRQDTTKKMNLFDFQDRNAMLFVIPMTTDGGTSHAFVIMNLRGNYKECKFIVDSNDPHPILFSKRALDYTCGPPYKFEKVVFALKVQFRNFKAEIVDNLIGKYF